MKRLLLALTVLATAGQIMPLFRHYDDDRPGLLERVATKPARIVDPEYDEEFEERKDPRDRRRYNRHRRYGRYDRHRRYGREEVQRSPSELSRIEADVEEYV